LAPAAPPRAAGGSRGLPPERRLRRPAQFKEVYETGRRLGNEFFTANLHASAAGCARLGMSIAARTLRRAVDRNRLRRLIRESFRAHQLALPPLDMVIGVRAAVRTADNARLRGALEQLWQKITSTCA
jgi:ribonuclease P protein component